MMNIIMENFDMEEIVRILSENHYDGKYRSSIRPESLELPSFDDLMPIKDICNESIFTTLKKEQFNNK